MNFCRPARFLHKVLDKGQKLGAGVAVPLSYPPPFLSLRPKLHRARACHDGNTRSQGISLWTVWIRYCRCSTRSMGAPIAGFLLYSSHHTRLHGRCRDARLATLVTSLQTRQAISFAHDWSTPRVVRVGTHAVSANSRTTFWNRLHTNGGSSSVCGNHRGSIFRKRVGKVLLQVKRYPSGDCCFLGIGNSAAKDIRLAEILLEDDVSAVIGEMHFLWIEVGDAPGVGSDRASLERNGIDLLSNFGKEPIDKPSANWLGCTR